MRAARARRAGDAARAPPVRRARRSRHVEAAVAAVYGWERRRATGARSRRRARSTASPPRARGSSRSPRDGGRIAVRHRAPGVAARRSTVDSSARAGAGGRRRARRRRDRRRSAPSGRRVRWVDEVAVLTDGAALLGDDSIDAARRVALHPRPARSRGGRPHLRGRRGGDRARGGRVRRPRRGGPRRRRVAGPGGPGRAPRRATPTPGLRRARSTCWRSWPPAPATRSTRSDPGADGLVARLLQHRAAGAYARPCGEAGETEGVSQWRNHSPRRDS